MGLIIKLMEKKWVIKERGDSGLVKQLAGDLGVSESLANLMVQRKITTPGEARKFFNPSLDYLHDPFLMKDMNRAVDRLSEQSKKVKKFWSMAIMMSTVPRQSPWYIHFLRKIMQTSIIIFPTDIKKVMEYHFRALTLPLTIILR